MDYYWYAGVLEIPTSAQACETYQGEDSDKQYQWLSLFAQSAQAGRPLRSPARLMTPAFFREIVFTTLDPNYPRKGETSAEIRRIATLLNNAVEQQGCFEATPVNALSNKVKTDTETAIRALPENLKRLLADNKLDLDHLQTLLSGSAGKDDTIDFEAVQAFNQLVERLLAQSQADPQGKNFEWLRKLLKDDVAVTENRLADPIATIERRAACAQTLQPKFSNIIKQSVSIDLERWEPGRENLSLRRAYPFIDQFDREFLRIANRLNLPQLKSRATRSVSDLATQLADSFVLETAGIDPGTRPDSAYGWRAEFYKNFDSTLSAKTLRLAQLSAKACRHVPVEFGGTNLTPPDRIKQGQKAAIGALVIEPKNSFWIENFDDTAIDRQNPGNNQTNKRMSRATATVVYPTDNQYRWFRDLVMMHQKGLNLRYEDGSAVANLAAEKEHANEAPDRTAPEDAHDAGHMAINYAAEPLWFRYGLPSDAPFGKEGFGGVASAWQAFSNRCCSNSTPSTGGTVISADQLVGEPYVPIMTAYAGREMRIRALMPTGVGRASTIELHGHGWPRDPYLAERVDGNSFPIGGRPTDWGVGSKCIGQNPMAMHMGGQESIAPMAHFDLVFPRAGGKHGITGDFLWRDHGGFGITSGLWAVIRVKPSTLLPPAPLTLRRQC